MEVKTITDLARHLEQPFNKIAWAIEVGLIPAPDIIHGKKKVYSKVQWKKVLEYFRPRLTGGHGITDLAKMANTASVTIRKWHERGLIPDPAGIKGRREVWTDEQVEEILQRVPQLKKRMQVDPPKGLYAKKHAARVLGVPNVTFRYWLKCNQIPGPAHEGPRCIRYYTDADLESIRKIKSDYFKSRS